MHYYLDNKRVNIHPYLLKKLGAGQEGKVYSYNNKALKIYRKTKRKNTLNLETCEYLKKFQTERILLPQEILTDKNHNIKGYTTEQIKNKQDIYNISKHNLLEELYKLKKEIDYLSTNYIEFDDWITINFMYDGKMRFVDCGNYEVLKELNIDDIKDDNYKILKNFMFRHLIEDRIYELTKKSISASTSIYSINIQCDTKKYPYVANFLEKSMLENSTLDEYIKTKIIK